MKKVIIFFLGLVLIVSAAVAVTKKDVQSQPDLTVTDVKVDTSKAKTEKKITVQYTVKNQGKAPTKPSMTSISIMSKEGEAMTKTIFNDVPSLPPGQGYTATVDYPVMTKGNYILKTTADYNAMLSESDESNNHNTLSFSFGFAIGNSRVKKTSK